LINKETPSHPILSKGEGYKKISKAVLINQNTVAKMIQKFKKDGTRLLMRRIEENRHASSLQFAKEGESQTGVTVSRDIILLYVHHRGMACMARLEFARTKVNVSGTDGFKTEWRRKGEEYKEECMVPTVKHGGGRVLMRGCMSAAAVRELHFIDGVMNSQRYCSILKEKILPSLHALGHRALF
uniref:Transposase Tc1-like domain-containing protein n=1 Tax=Paramormyrops kingsleyae TaxID=1676925 RepID=A0A3B3SUE8_9TELE